MEKPASKNLLQFLIYFGLHKSREQKEKEKYQEKLLQELQILKA
tara:strand:+ start:645 stop:776 length:132 start_codon:yes stop_codon:yes gene_type:complete